MPQIPFGNKYHFQSGLHGDYQQMKPACLEFHCFNAARDGHQFGRSFTWTVAPRSVQVEKDGADSSFLLTIPVAIDLTETERLDKVSAVVLPVTCR
jgi:hypothetical protein